MNDASMLGKTVSFIPSAFIEYVEKTGKTLGQIPVKVSGQIVQINAQKSWFRVMYSVHGWTGFECFKF